MSADLSAVSRRDVVLQIVPGFCQYPPSLGTIVLGKVVREEGEFSFYQEVAGDCLLVAVGTNG